MKVLTISGDRSFKAGNPRFDLQFQAVERFEVVYWGPRAPFPKIPAGPFDVVSSQDPFLRGLVAWFMARHYGARLNVQVHADLSAQNIFRKMLAWFVLREADSIRAVSERVKKQVEAHKVQVPIAVLSIFIDGEKFKNIIRTLDAHPLVLWVGRFEKEKNPLEALSVLKQVQEKIPTVKMVMLGAGSMERVLRERARGLPVEFPGWSDVVPFLARAHVVLSTSKAESFGASLVEARLAGVPVVSLDVGVAREVGAYVIAPSKIAEEVVRVLSSHPAPSAGVAVLSKEEWIKKWKESLL